MNVMETTNKAIFGYIFHRTASNARWINNSQVDPIHCIFQKVVNASHTLVKNENNGDTLFDIFQRYPARQHLYG